MNDFRTTLRRAAFAAALALGACSSADPSQAERSAESPSASTDGAIETPASDPMTADPDPSPSARTEIATFGAGCFWCIEAVLEQAEGVLDARSGYMGGHVEDPTYKQVCSGTTGHAEVVQVTFDPARITYEDLVRWFWQAHDPTTLNRQGADAGTQYRSAIFVHSPEQRRVAEASKAAEDASGRHRDPIVTEITDASTFYEAEADHQDFYRLNPNYGYCRVVIAPKLDKLGLKK